jgi:hypothetical protein
VTSSDPLTLAREVKARHEADLMARPGVVGVGVGLRQRGGQITEELAIVVMVRRKRSPADLPAPDLLPADIEGVPVDVQEAGDITTGSELLASSL